MKPAEERVEEAFVTGVRALADVEGGGAAARLGGLAPAQARAVLEDMIYSRQADLAARRLRADGRGYYTIASAGHEANAVVAAALRPDDPALLHYRSGAFFLHRARMAREAGGPEVDALRSILLGVVAARDEPIAGGRHKVLGSAPLWVLPQTSTIASQLPRALGMAFAMRQRARLRQAPALPEDAVVICSLGDASMAHSTAAGALQAAGQIAHRGLPLPLVVVCEDNGLGISVPTPAGWIAAAFGARPGLAYFAAESEDLGASFAAARAAVEHARTRRRPALLHLSCVRLLGHAGSDVELAYRTPEELRRDEARDPLLAAARLVIEVGVMTAAEVLELRARARAEVEALAGEVADAPGLADADAIVAPLAPRSSAAIAAAAQVSVDVERRAAFWGARLPEREGPLPLAAHVTATLGDLLVERPELLIFGEDVGRKGGVYGLTRGLQRRAGVSRVFDTLLDEQTILGLALGAGPLGLLPIPEIQYLAYLHNAIDQLRGEAATLQFFSRGQLRNPMVVRVASFADPRGFGGHFHNDNAIAALREIPGLVIAAPSRGDDAAALLRTCVAAAAACGSVCVLLEPIALYRAADVFEPGDGRLLSPYDPAPAHAPIGAPRLYEDEPRDASDGLLLVSFASGVVLARRVARRLATTRGVKVRVLDLRWLAPLPIEALTREAAALGRVLVIDETRATGGVAEGVLARLIDHGFSGPMARVAARDSFIPLGPAAYHVLPSEEEAERAAAALLEREAVTRREC